MWKRRGKEKERRNEWEDMRILVEKRRRGGGEKVRCKEAKSQRSK